MTRTKKYLLTVVTLLCCAAWVAGCKQERSPCLSLKTANLTLHTRHFASDTATIFTDSSLHYPIFIPLKAIPAVTDTQIGGVSATFSTLTLSPDDTMCQWLFSPDSVGRRASVGKQYDTLTFHYERNRQFLSNACGYTYFYTLTSVNTTHAAIDSVRITNASVTNNVNATKNLDIYMHPIF